MERASPSPALTVLVADDDADMRLYVAGCLRGIGVADVVTAADGREALHLARALALDLVISDVMMPGLNGRALARALKSDEATSSVPVLLISGETQVDQEEGDGFLAKPFNATSLRAEVERLISLPP